MWYADGLLFSTKVNEGTTFSESVLGLNLTGTAQDDAFVDFVGHLFIDNSTLTNDVYDKILEMWPANDPLLGAPFNTGDSLFDRAEAWYTDAMFLSPRRLFFENAAPLQPMFAYYFREFYPGDDFTLGGKYFSTRKYLHTNPLFMKYITHRNYLCSLVQYQIPPSRLILPIKCSGST